VTRANDRPLVLASVTVDGAIRDVYVAGGVIQAVTAPGLPAPDGLEYVSLDLAGHVLLPAAAEPHAHLDKALLADRVPNPSGDLDGAINAIRMAYPSMSVSDIGQRALAAVTEAAAKGFTAVRTHSDCGPSLGTRSVAALVGLRESLRDVMDIQVVALAEPGLTGTAGRANRQVLAAAMAAGADLVGGCPSIDEDPRAAVTELLAIAREAGRGLDLHVDESVDRDMLVLKDLADQVTKTGFDLRVTASHCVSLGVQDTLVAREVSAAVAAANIAVVTLPQSNLFLQGRSTSTGKPRGLTAIEELLAAGVRVAGGGDNWRDPFNPMGRIDPLETASLLVTAGHQAPDAAYACVSGQARWVLGLPAVQVAPGSPADLLAVRASSLADAVAGASEHRLVLRAGRILAWTTVHHEWDPGLTQAAHGIVASTSAQH
jgi:cytosine/creatinine deaminase